MGKLSRGYITKVRGLARRLARGLCKGGGKYLRHCEVLYIRTRSQSQGANKWNMANTGNLPGIHKLPRWQSKLLIMMGLKVLTFHGGIRENMHLCFFIGAPLYVTQHGEWGKQSHPSPLSKPTWMVKYIPCATINLQASVKCSFCPSLATLKLCMRQPSIGWCYYPRGIPLRSCSDSLHWDSF